MKYFFILGNNPALSVAEILSRLETDGYAPVVDVVVPSFLVLTVVRELPRDLLQVLGGTIKFGLVRLRTTHADLGVDIQALLDEHQLAAQGRFHFGLSAYPVSKKMGYQLRGVGLAAKKQFKANGFSARLVMSKQDTLSSVVVEKNKLISNQGVEVVVLRDGSEYLLGTTMSVQPFAALNDRDFSRPARDDVSGMIPPKLAQIMLNLAGVSHERGVLDPCCGSGTIGQEALLYGAARVQCSDIAAKAVTDTKANFSWLESRYRISTPYEVVQMDARKLLIPDDSIDCIVTESFLGTPLRGELTTEQATHRNLELQPLYHAMIQELARVLRVGGRLVMVWPAPIVKRAFLLLSKTELLRDTGLRFVSVVPSAIAQVLPLSSRNTFVYAREGQYIAREIVVLEK